MRKNVTCILLAGIMTVTFAGCGGNEEKTDEVSSEKSAVSQQSEESGSDDVSEKRKFSDDESIYISDDPYEYAKYPGEWKPVNEEPCTIEILPVSDTDFTITIHFEENDAVESEWDLTGKFKAEEGGIYYMGTMQETDYSQGIVKNIPDCEGYLRIVEDGTMKWTEYNEGKGSNLTFRRTDT